MSVGVQMIPQTPAERALLLEQVISSWSIEGQNPTPAEQALYDQWVNGSMDVATLLRRVEQLVRA